MADSVPPAPSKEWVLDAETEYRFELDPDTSFAIKLVRGRAEIFGAELVQGKKYLFALECKAAVYTWQGCTIEVTGQPSTEYVSEETPMAPYANVHTALEQMRVRALSKARGSPLPPGENADSKFLEAPRVLILGPENSGKTTICKILANYAVRTGQGWTPVLANVDPTEGAWAIPGTLSAAAIPGPIQTYSPANPLGSAATTAPLALASHSLVPLVSWYGHTDTKRNPLLLDRLVRNLGENVNDRFDLSPEVKASGLIVDTPSSFASSSSPTDHRQKLIKACVNSFRINVILVVGHEKLNVEMQRAYGSYVTVVKIPKSGGVVEIDSSYRERVQRYQLHTYMYGHAVQPPAGVTGGTLGGETLSDLVLSPSSTVIKFGDLSIYQIGTENMAPSSALPINAHRQVSEMQPVPVNPASPGSGLLGSVLALLSPFNPDENERYDEEILDLSVAGFIYVTHIDVKQRKMTILSPNQGSVVGKTALIGSVEYQDQ
ncbi:cleavage/polyadenylation factor ia subunit Clp1p [Coprinopsis marcescibilis]|uniref:Polynucleotide 5'-hydroxyl-kinase GRC3 n=1 Tax=Coprinopsis marcescibilis TaxID=230819 RepID=A0A5C3LBK1_COPMA|nr:cleavage/polyadenylation factor ia subunit Clp1p [Coprinopsis marcescibilis]